MKLSNIALGLVAAAFVGVKFLGVYVDNQITGSHKGPKSEVTAIITDINVLCAQKAEETYALSDCSPSKNSDTERTKTHLTYKFRLENEKSYRVHTVYFNGKYNSFTPKTGKQIPILVSDEDPTYSRPNYNKLPD